MKVSSPQDHELLIAAFLQMKSADELARFLADLCTPGEIAALSERWAIARLLNDGKLGYRDIAAQTRASTTTVARVARFLTQESHQGYRLALQRLSGAAAGEKGR